MESPRPLAFTPLRASVPVSKAESVCVVSLRMSQPLKGGDIYHLKCPEDSAVLSPLALDVGQTPATIC